MELQWKTKTNKIINLGCWIDNDLNLDLEIKITNRSSQHYSVRCLKHRRMARRCDEMFRFVHAVLWCWSTNVESDHYWITENWSVWNYDFTKGFSMFNATNEQTLQRSNCKGELTAIINCRIIYCPRRVT